MEQDERRLINMLRNYYYDNYVHGKSDEAFIIWLDDRLIQLRIANADKPNKDRPRWLRDED